MQLPAPHRTQVALDRLNAASAEDAVSLLASCCGSTVWARRVAAFRPYPSAEALLAASDEAYFDLSEAEVDTAMADEACGAADLVEAALAGRDGREPPGGHAARIALRVAHEQYCRRFGRPFVMCVHGYRPSEALDQVLAGIRQRLGNAPEDERSVAAEELRRVIRTRLVRLLAEPPE